MWLWNNSKHEMANWRPTKSESFGKLLFICLMIAISPWTQYKIIYFSLSGSSSLVPLGTFHYLILAVVCRLKLQWAGSLITTHRRRSNFHLKSDLFSTPNIRSQARSVHIIVNVAVVEGSWFWHGEGAPAQSDLKIAPVLEAA